MEQTRIEIDNLPPRHVGAPAIAVTGRGFTFSVLRILDADPERIVADLEHHLAQHPNFFHRAPVVLDLQAVAEAPPSLTSLIAALRERGLIPVAVQHCPPELLDEALACGLAETGGGGGARRERSVRPPSEPQAAAPRRLRVVRQPIRSGQQVYAADADLVVVGTVNPGAEVLADGSIHIYGALHGKALAGVKGDAGCAIFCNSFGAELIAIAGTYLSADEMAAVPRDKVVQVTLRDGALVIE